MHSAGRFRKDYYGGALLVLVGLLASSVATTYKIGTLSAMGPGFFPCAVGVLMAATGVLIALSARAPEAKEESGGPSLHPTGMPDIRGAVAIVLSVVAFVFIGDWFGLLPATFAIVFISALGDRGNKWWQAVVLSIAMMVVAAVVFHWALQLQLPLVKWEF